MDKRKIKISCLILSLLAFAVTLSSCSDIYKVEISKKASDAVLLYSAGFNNLSSYLKEDITELQNAYLPKYNDNKMLFVFSHFPEYSGNYKKRTSPKLERYYKDKDGLLVKETILTLDTLTTAADARTVTKVLKYIDDNYDIDGLGMVFSSHATGYLPAGYFSNSSKYESLSVQLASVPGYPGLVEYVDPYPEGDHPLTKTIGQENVTIDGKSYVYEMELSDFAKAIPLKLDYILFDACLMGGIEVAYELKDKADVIGFSPTEILADGLNYNTLMSHLLEKSEPDLVAVSEDYIDHYMAQQGEYRSATWTLVDCSKLNQIADKAAQIFEKYSEGITTMSASGVQRFFYKSDKHWHFDLLSLVSKCGASESETKDFEKLLDQSIIYKGATPKFIGVTINTYSGYSMMLPSQAGSYLKNHYKTLSWNKKTGLVAE